MASFAIAPSCTASRPSLQSSRRHSFAASRLPAPRTQRAVVAAAQQSNKVNAVRMPQQYSPAQIRLQHS